jgi:hypothetical protein
MEKNLGLLKLTVATVSNSVYPTRLKGKSL